MYCIIGFCFNLISRVKRKSLEKFYLKKLKKRGKNCSIGSFNSCSYQNVTLGDNVSLGNNTTFLSSNAEIIIKNNVMFGPQVSIITGDHRINVLGKNMRQVTEKEKENDANVIINDDCWIGANVIILKGVTIGKGSVIGAGSIVTKSMPPYSIVTGEAAKILKKRFTLEEINKHERLIDEREK